MTEYIILQAQASAGEHPPQGWKIVGRGPGRSSRSVIAGYLDGREEQGQFVAVPARSWKPVTVKVETKTALKFS